MLALIEAENMLFVLALGGYTIGSRPKRLLLRNRLGGILVGQYARIGQQLQCNHVDRVF